MHINSPGQPFYTFQHGLNLHRSRIVDNKFKIVYSYRTYNV